MRIKIVPIFLSAFLIWHPAGIAREPAAAVVDQAFLLRAYQWCGRADTLYSGLTFTQFAASLDFTELKTKVSNCIDGIASEHNWDSFEARVGKFRSMFPELYAEIDPVETIRQLIASGQSPLSRDSVTVHRHAIGEFRPIAKFIVEHSTGTQTWKELLIDYRADRQRRLEAVVAEQRERDPSEFLLRTLERATEYNSTDLGDHTGIRQRKTTLSGLQSLVVGIIEKSLRTPTFFETMDAVFPGITEDYYLMGSVKARAAGEPDGAINIELARYLKLVVQNPRGLKFHTEGFNEWRNSSCIRGILGGVVSKSGS